MKGLTENSERRLLELIRERDRINATIDAIINNLIENIRVMGNKANYDWLMESKKQLESGKAKKRDGRGEEDGKKEELEFNKRIDAYLEQAYYQGTSKWINRRHDPLLSANQMCYIQMLERGNLQSEVKCIVIHKTGIEIMDLPLLRPKVMRKKWIEGMEGDGLLIDDFNSIDKDRFYKEFDKAVMNLRRTSEQSKKEMI